MQSYEPDKVPDFDVGAYNDAREAGYQPIHVLCDEPGAAVNDVGGVSFFCFGAFIPRVGEKIQLENGARCRVQSITYVLRRWPSNPKVLTLTPNVYAVRINSDDD